MSGQLPTGRSAAPDRAGEPPEWFTAEVRRTAGDRPSGPPPGPLADFEEGTLLIQRITDEAVPDEVVDAAAGMKTARTSGIVKAGAMMAVATVVSRLTGLLSKIVIVAVLGTTVINNSYTLANTLPNIVFELLIGGVLTSVAIPLLTRAQRSDSDGGLLYTQRLTTMVTAGLVVATGLAVLAAPWLSRLYLTSGSDTVDIGLATSLARLLLPQIFFYGLAAMFGAILNTNERFAANAWAPVLNNVVVIGVGIALAFSIRPGQTELTAEQFWLLGGGTTLGIVAQALVMLPSLRRSGFRFRFRWGWDPRLSEAGGLVAWAIGYVLISQVGVIVTTKVASRDDVSGGLVIFQNASLLFQMPYGIVGVAVLTAIMPRLSRHAAAGQLADVKDDMSLANRLSAVALLPVSAGLVVLGAAISYLLFRHGQMGTDAVLIIGGTLGAMAVGLVPLAITLVQMRVFYAMKDGRTPTLINAIMVAVRVPLLMLSVRLDDRLIIPGLAAATAFSYLVGAVVGEIWLRARFGPMGTRRTLVTIVKMTVASAAGGAAGYFGARYLVGIEPDSLLDALRICLVAGVIGLVVIAALATALKVEELLPLRRRIARLFRRGQATASTPAEMGGSFRPPPAPPREQVNQRVTADTDGARSAPGPAGSDDATRRIGAAEGDDRTVSIASTARTGAGVPVSAGAADADQVGSHTVDLGSTPTVTIAPPAQLSPGATVGGRYRLVTLIATDSAGNRFWRAKDTVLPRDMAVTLLPDGNSTSATVARTLRVGRLHHIGLPQTLDVGSQNGQSYVVGQWVDGATLTDLLSGGPLEPDVATSITAKLSEAVAEAHRNGIALGAIHPSLVRVNFDGQVRISHVIAHGSATPEQDIRAVGALLYLMLTGTWPLTTPSSRRTARPGSGETTVQLTDPGTAGLPPAATRLGREVPADEVRPEVPEALSALAERALHPDEPAGIHAVGAIAALLRRPETTTVSAAESALETQASPTLGPAERRIINERRAKLSVAAVMLAAFAALIIIVVASLIKQFMTAVQDPAANAVPPGTPVSAATAPASTGATSASGSGAGAKTASTSGTPTPATGSAAGSKPSVSQSATVSSQPAIPSAPIAVANATVYDPQGDGNKDNTGQAGRAFDNDASSAWKTFIYNQQFPTVKTGVGLTLELEKPIVVTSVQVTTDTPGTVVQIRAATGADQPLDQTKVLGTGTISAAGQPTSIPVANAALSKYLIVFVTKLASVDDKFQSDLNEIVVNGH